MLLNHDEEFIQDCKLLNEVWGRLKRRGAIAIYENVKGLLEVQMYGKDFEGDLFETKTKGKLEKVASIGGVKILQLQDESEEL